MSVILWLSGMVCKLACVYVREVAQARYQIGWGGVGGGGGEGGGRTGGEGAMRDENGAFPPTPP